METKKNQRATFSARENLPEFGAIFMANRATMEECLHRKLFGLPSSQRGFVRGVQTGMVLFLFEYEERLLYGVFRASSNGRMNIVPQAYGSRFPAQVRFSKIWDCGPLREDDFRDAIKENYYANYKFLFGLSEAQVSKLLVLFNSRRTEVSISRSLSREREWNKYPSRIGSEYTETRRKKLTSVSSFCTSKRPKHESPSGSRDTETERSAFLRKISFVRSVATSKQPKSSSPDHDVKDKARVSLPSGELGVGTSSPKREPGPIDFRERVEAAIYKDEEPQNRKDSSKDLGGDTEDFIPLGSPDSLDNEIEFPENDHTESIAFERYFPVKLVACENLRKEENESSLQVNNDLKLNVSDNKGNEENQSSLQVEDDLKLKVFDNKEDQLGIKALYSDDHDNRSSVFSRLNFGSKDVGRENRVNNSEDNLAGESRGDSPQSHGNEKNTTFSHLPRTSKVSQDIHDRNRTTMEEIQLAPEDGECHGEMGSSVSECEGRRSEEETKGTDPVQEIMDSLLQRQSARTKIDSDHEASEQEDFVVPRVKKSVFSRLSWGSESCDKDTVSTRRLKRGNGLGIKRQKSQLQREPFL